MARYQVILEYDGTEYFGFQRQAEGRDQRTVQWVVETALRHIGWQGVSILAAGRTDTGVHAKGQVIAFDLDWNHSLQDLLAAFNANLPLDAVASCVKIVSDNFHPRFDALSRTYQYRIICQPTRDPLRERYVWRIQRELDFDILKQSARSLVGIHDFSAFGAPPRPGGTTIRQVFQCDWLKQQDEFVFEIQANAFLYHMVRRLVGFQVVVGQGRYGLQDLASRLTGGDHDLVKELAPPQGLSLITVEYPDNVVIRTT